MILQEEEVIKLIEDNRKAPNWLLEARKNHKTYKALVYGDNFLEELIQRIEKLESADRAQARKKYSKDIRDMFHRVFEPRENVFNASGGSKDIEVPSNQNREKLLEHLSQYKGNKSIHQYLSEYYFQLLDVDPNGVIFTEYKDDEKIYPTYKSIDAIRNYVSDGQNVEWIIFEPEIVVKKGGLSYQKWRVVDDKNDWCIIETNGQFAISKEKSFNHPFGKAPAIILSGYQKVGSELRLSPLFPIEELAKDYARDKSVLTLYKFLNGFPIHWRYRQQCRTCRGVGKTGKNPEDKCSVCDGKGYLGKSDVTDIMEVNIPEREEDKILAPNLAGFISPDLETWKQYNEELNKSEKLIHNTIWGTKDAANGGGETATGRFIDVQPVINRLSKMSDSVEWFHNQLQQFVLNWVENNPQTKSVARVSYGKGFIIEGADVLLERYDTNRSKGSNVTILDRLLLEYITAKYRTAPKMLENALKKAELEPYVHLSFKETKDIFGDKAAEKKDLFHSFWEEADKNKPLEVLKSEFATYITKKQANPQTT